MKPKDFAELLKSIAEARAIRAGKRASRFRAALGAVNRRYAKTLKTLAE